MPRAKKTAPTAPPPTGGKLETITALLQRGEGATLDELVTATGWQSHSVRGAMAGALKKKGNTITSVKADGVRTYRIGGEAA